jgi:CheY-like chemotaxis protein
VGEHRRHLLGRGLRFEGFDVQCAYSGAEAIRLTAQATPDLVLLDVGMPDQDGSTVLRELDVPVVMLTARDEVSDKVGALDMGADDYLAKPFALDELLARIRAVLRRRHADTLDKIGYADLCCDLGSHEVIRDDRLLDRDRTRRRRTRRAVPRGGPRGTGLLGHLHRDRRVLAGHRRQRHPDRQVRQPGRSDPADARRRPARRSCRIPPRAPPATGTVTGEAPTPTGSLSKIDYSERIPNNVNLASDRKLQRALEGWQLRSPDGYYSSLGRTDDIIKAGGIWVSPTEVEERLRAHPDISRAGPRSPPAAKPRSRKYPVCSQRTTPDLIARLCLQATDSSTVTAPTAFPMVIPFPSVANPAGNTTGAGRQRGNRSPRPSSRKLQVNPVHEDGVLVHVGPRTLKRCTPATNAVPVSEHARAAATRPRRWS